MTEEELRKQATSTVEWENTPLQDRPQFVHAYIVGAKSAESRIEKLEKEITELEKENAELKEKLEDTEKARDYWKNSSFDWRHKCTSRKPFRAAVKAQKQLSKAKEILRKFLDAKSIEETCVAESEAEQFLKEVYL